MKETNIEKYFTKKEKNVDINIRPLFINCIISIFSLCFLMDFYYFCKLRSNGMPVPLLRNGYSIFNGTKYR